MAVHRQVGGCNPLGFHHGVDGDLEINYQHDIRQINQARILVARLSEQSCDPDPKKCEGIPEALAGSRRAGGLGAPPNQDHGFASDGLPGYAAGERVRGFVQALRLAEPAGYMRVFLDEGAGMLICFKQSRPVLRPGDPIAELWFTKSMAAFEGLGCRQQRLGLDRSSDDP